MYFIMPLNCTLKMVVYGAYTSPLEREREGEKEKGKGKYVLVRTPLTRERELPELDHLLLLPDLEETVGSNSRQTVQTGCSKFCSFFMHYLHGQELEL